MSNSRNLLAAAAAATRAVAASGRAALPDDFSAPLTEAQQKILQTLPSGTLGIDADVLLEMLEGVPDRLAPGAGSVAMLRRDVAYADNLLKALRKPSRRMQGGFQEGMEQRGRRYISGLISCFAAAMACDAQHVVM